MRSTHLPLRALLLDWLGQASILAMMLWMPTGQASLLAVKAFKGRSSGWFSVFALSLAGLAIRELHPAEETTSDLSGAVEAPCYHCNLHSNGGGHCPLADQSSDSVWLVSRRVQLLDWCADTLGARGSCRSAHGAVAS